MCTYCRSLLVRHDKDVENIGKMAELPADISPFQIGTSGIHKNVGFTLVGRMKIGWHSGVWNEWFFVDNKARKGWLAEAQGFLAISYESEELFDSKWRDAMATHVKDDNHVGTSPNLPLTMGDYITIGKKKYQVSDIKEASCIGSEGELPFISAKGRKTLAVDLLSATGDFAGMECDEAGICRQYLGEYVEFNDLRFTNLRELPGWKISRAQANANQLASEKKDANW